MDLALATHLLFLSAVALGVVGFRHSLVLGDLMPAPMRWWLRALFGLFVCLGVWGELAYALWMLGVPLKIGSIANGRIQQAWWLGPAACVFAMTSYGLLRESTSGRRAWAFSKTLGGIVLIGLATIVVVFALGQLPADAGHVVLPTR